MTVPTQCKFCGSDDLYQQDEPIMTVTCGPCEAQAYLSNSPNRGDWDWTSGRKMSAFRAIVNDANRDLGE